MPEIPVYQEYMNPVLAALRALGRPATISELESAVAQRMKLSPDVLGILHDPERRDGQSEVGYRIAWARTYLKKAGYLQNPERGLWALTELGKRADTIDARALAASVGKSIRAGKGDPLQRDDLDLHPVIAQELSDAYRELAASLPTPEQLESYYAAFRRRFGPDVLAGLDGEELLLRMHERRTKESLVYWLEFKDDEEMPARFGSISGGSALKFDIYQNVETGRWMTGHPLAQEALSVPEAIALVRQQRDELVAGARVLERYRAQGWPIDYAALDREIVGAAPRLHAAGWGHKYFSLQAPELIDDYHAADWQRHHLLRLLKRPAEGRYAASEGLCGLARALGWPTNHLTTVLNRVHGNPCRYWRLDVGVRGDLWNVMLTQNVCAYDERRVPALTGLSTGAPGRRRIREMLQSAGVDGGDALVRQLYTIAVGMSAGDRVLATRASRVIGIGIVQGEYAFAVGAPGAHRRPVEWVELAEWDLPDGKAQDVPIASFGKDVDLLLEVERRLVEPRTPTPIAPITEQRTPSVAPAPLTGVLARLSEALERKRQIILYGPPGTGKTHWATLAANELAARSWFKRSFDALEAEQRDVLAKQAVATCCFHPAYGYEDFIEGYRPVQAAGGALAFELRSGVFKQLARTAAEHPDREYFLVIDEINRGDVPRIFGELLLVLERDKRGRPVRLPVSGEELVVPDNVYVIGTMNTADRSVALLDAALRRRFSFVELLPDTNVLKGSVVSGIPLGPWLDELNRRVLQHAGRDARNLQVGHSYLLEAGSPILTLTRFAEVLRDDIIPLLQEYCYEDFSALERILGAGLVSRKTQRVNDGLFSVERHPELVQALLAAFDTIIATPEAVAADAEAETADDDDGGADSATEPND